MEGVEAMRKIGAYTGPTGPGYPAYANITIEDDEVTITVRGEPKVRDGCYVCSHAPGPGNCTAGGPTCNNYCNMAPEKGPMQDRPLPCQQVFEGPYAQMKMPKAEFDAMMEHLK